MNQLDTLYETSFAGPSSLRALSLFGNQISQLPVNVFQSLTALETLVLSDNRLESIDGRLLANSSNLVRIDLARNQINAIGRSFLNGLPRLHSLSTLVNRCSNNFWIIGGSTTIATIQQGLSECFNNNDNNLPEVPDVPENELKTFTIELRGSLIIRDEDGNQIIRL